MQSGLEIIVSPFVIIKSFDISIRWYGDVNVDPFHYGNDDGIFSILLVF